MNCRYAGKRKFCHGLASCKSGISLCDVLKMAATGEFVLKFLVISREQNCTVHSHFAENVLSCSTTI